MKGVPAIVGPARFRRDDLPCVNVKGTTQWVPARPLGFQGLCLLTRLRRAWMVFTGQADVLVWEDGQ